MGAQGLFKQYSAEGDEALTPAANSNAFGAYLYQEVALTGSGAKDERAVSLQMGGRFDTYGIESKTGVTKFGPGRTVQVNSPSGSLGLSVPLGESVTLNGSAALAFRAPSVEELFSNAVHAAAADYEVGNPGLKVEKNEGFDGQLRWQSGRANATVGGYLNMIQGYIYPDMTRDTVVDGTTMPLARMSQKDARLSGVEASGEFRMSSHVVAGMMGDYVKGRFRDASGPLPFMPPGRLGASLRWDNGKYNVGADVKHGFRQADVTGGQDIATDAYTLLQLSAGLNLIVGGRVHTLTLRVDNVGDTRYYDATSRIKTFSPNPGRNAALVYKVLF
jgi:iron complex outermembrane receptor protein